MVLNFFIDGRPIAQTRPRVANGGVYYDKRVIAFRENVKNQTCNFMSTLFNSFLPQFPLKNAVCISLSFVKNFSITAKNFGDTDNLAKIMLDAFNGLLYNDDSQIIRLHVEKHKPSHDQPAEGVFIFLTDSLNEFYGGLNMNRKTPVINTFGDRANSLCSDAIALFIAEVEQHAKKNNVLVDGHFISHINISDCTDGSFNVSYQIINGPKFERIRRITGYFSVKGNCNIHRRCTARR